MFRHCLEDFERAVAKVHDRKEDSMRRSEQRAIRHLLKYAEDSGAEQVAVPETQLIFSKQIIEQLNQSAARSYQSIWI